jgi:hypothetical protein
VTAISHERAKECAGWPPGSPHIPNMSMMDSWRWRSRW